MHTKNSNNTIKVSIEQNTRTQNTKYIHRTTTTTNKTKHFQISTLTIVQLLLMTENVCYPVIQNI